MSPEIKSVCLSVACSAREQFEMFMRNRCVRVQLKLTPALETLRHIAARRGNPQLVDGTADGQSGDLPDLFLLSPEFWTRVPQGQLQDTNVKCSVGSVERLFHEKTIREQI